jgi:hypothetical protein
LPANVNTASLDWVTALGLPVMVVSGRVESTVHVLVAGVPSWLPAASRAATENVWEPSERLKYVIGLVQGCGAPPSGGTRRSRPPPAS